MIPSSGQSPTKRGWGRKCQQAQDSLSIKLVKLDKRSQHTNNLIQRASPTQLSCQNRKESQQSSLQKAGAKKEAEEAVSNPELLSHTEVRRKRKAS